VRIVAKLDMRKPTKKRKISNLREKENNFKIMLIAWSFPMTISLNNSIQEQISETEALKTFMETHFQECAFLK
jgi:hypothetical protein